jgi:hypothetical protein
VSVTSAVPPSGRPAGARWRASRLGYRVGSGLVAVARTGTATTPMAEAAARMLYLEGPRAAAPPGWLGTGAAGPAGNPVVVSACHGDLRYDVPGESGRAGTAIASFQAAVACNSHISAPGRRCPVSARREQGHAMSAGSRAPGGAAAARAGGT